MSTLNKKQAKQIGTQLGINWSDIDLTEFTMGINIEFEHGTRYSDTNVTDDDPLLTGRIAWAHLIEVPDYYTRLTKMEKEAKDYWNEQRLLTENLFTSI